MSSFKRVSLSLPADLAADLEYVHQRVRVSKSALVATLLSQGVADLRKLFEDLPDDPTPDDIRRLRGASAELVGSRVREYIIEAEASRDAQ